MKEKIKYYNLSLLLYTILLFISTPAVYAQWNPDVRLTNDTAGSIGSYNHTKWIASSGNSIHIVWRDYMDGTSGIYYKRSTNGGSTWSNDFKISGDSSYNFQPSIAVSGSNLHVIWDTYLNGNEHICYIRSTNGGASWDNLIQLSTSPDLGAGNSISCAGSFINIVWVEMRDGNAELYYKKSTNNGTTWNQDTRVTNTPTISQVPSIGQSGSSVHIAWSESLNPGYEIYYKRSDDGGETWTTNLKLTGGVNLPLPWPQTMSVSGNNIHIAYPMQVIASDWDIFYRHSTNGGVTWLSESRITYILRPSTSPSIFSDGSLVHLAWVDLRNYEAGIYYTRSSDGGFTWMPDSKISNDTAGLDNPSITASSSGVHVAWNDNRDGNSEIYYKNNPTGNGNFSVSGLVTYKDNNQPVTGGFVKALKYNPQTAEITTIDSAVINSDGTYILNHIPEDSLDLMFYQDDDLLQFVPTYYVSTTDWREATKIYATQNLNNINCQVYRISNSANPYTISGLSVRNTDAFYSSGLKDAIIYAKIGNEFKNYGVSQSGGQYIVTKLPQGNYTLYAHRMGFLPKTMDVTISGSSLININFDFGNPVIGVQQISSNIPDKYDLAQNYPNPFNPVTTIKFGIPKSGMTYIRIFDILGRLVSTIVEENLNAGSYSLKWDASEFTSGVYFYRIESADYIETKKMILIK
jgi:hypothetical protein